MIYIFTNVQQEICDEWGTDVIAVVAPDLVLAKDALRQHVRTALISKYCPEITLSRIDGVVDKCKPDVVGPDESGVVYTHAYFE
jgi:hypothetical protein